MLPCGCGTLGPAVAAVLVRVCVCACKRLCERSCCGVPPPSFVSACGLVEEMHPCIVSVAPYRLCVCLQRLRLCACWCGRVAGLCAKAWVRAWLFDGHTYACIVCCVCRTYSLSRCCLYQATRDVDVAVKAPAVPVVSEGGVLWGTGSCAACVLWVYARFPHAALDNPAWSAVIALSRHIYPQPAHVVHGVLLHLIPMSWS